MSCFTNNPDKSHRRNAHSIISDIEAKPPGPTKGTPTAPIKEIFKALKLEILVAACWVLEMEVCARAG